MTFAAPAGLAAALLAAPLILWYVLRSRRPALPVASTFLWARTERSVSAALPWERFRPDRTFWLVLAALLAGALALARPVIPVEASLGDHTIVIVDVSASMLADEGGAPRLELALREIRDLAGRLGPGQAMSVVEAGPRARTLVSAAGDAATLRRAIAGLRPSHAPADLADAFTLAGALQRPGQATVTHLWTDRTIPPEAVPLAPAGMAVHPVGSDRPNLAVAALQAVPSAGGAEVFVSVRSYAPLGVLARVVLDLDGETVVERQVELAPRGTENLILPIDTTDAEGAVLHARVEAVGATVTGAPAADALALDDGAWAVLAGVARPRVLIAGPGNLFLEAAFGAVEGAEVATAPAVPDDLAGVDVLVVDRIPAPGVPRVPTLYVAPTSPPDGIVAGPPVERPALTSQDPDHDLLRDVDLSETAVAVAQVVEAPALTAVASGPSGPLLLAGRLEGIPVVYVPFDLQQSNLPLQVAWPVLAANTVAWLAGPPATAALHAGAEAVIPVPAGATGVVVSPPGGAEVRLDAARPRVLVDTVGIWRVAYEGPQEVVGELPPPTPLAVNATPGESDLAQPRPDPVAAAAQQAGEAQSGFRSVGRIVLLAVLALLLLEWLGAAGVHPVRWIGRRLRRRRAAPAGARS